jgi:hypothetical protein
MAARRTGTQGFRGVGRHVECIPNAVKGYSTVVLYIALFTGANVSFAVGGSSGSPVHDQLGTVPVERSIIEDAQKVQHLDCSSRHHNKPTFRPGRRRID